MKSTGCPHACLFSRLSLLSLVVAALLATVWPAAAQLPLTGNLLVNGSFEEPQVPPAQDIQPIVAGRLSGWRLSRGTVDVISPRGWQPAPGQGAQSLDLVGVSPGTIEQTFTTVPGQEYEFSGSMSHNPQNPVAPEGRADVFINGQFLVQLFHRDPQTTNADMRWVRFSHRFRAVGSSTTLSLVDVTNLWSLGGSALDGLSVTAVGETPPGAPRIGILPNPVGGGQTSVGLITLLGPAPVGDRVVSLASSLPAAAVAPAVVIVPAGATSATFSIVTLPVVTPTSVLLTATGPGGSGTATLLVLPQSASMPPGNLLVNGGFELPPVPGGSAQLNLKSNDLPGWRITRGSVDVAGAASWPVAPGEGRQSLDLVGDTAGTIEQTFPTLAGREYLFSGWVAHHPGNPVAPESRANVFLNGQLLVQLFHRDSLATAGDLRWTRFAYRFFASGAATTLTLADATHTSYPGGTLLDGLSITPVRTNLLVNASFEEPPIPAGQPHLVLEPDGLPGWRVAPGGVVLVAPYRWQPAPGGGGQMLHLLNPLVTPPGFAGTIEQSFRTEPGRLYVITGWLSHNPSRPEGRVQVTLNGEPLGQLSHTVALFGPSSVTEMRWQPFLFNFRAASAFTSLQIADVTGAAIAEGGVLDGLVVTPADDPAAGQVPVAPTGLTVRLISPTQIDLSWSDNSGDETGFEIERRINGGEWARLALLGPNPIRFSDYSVSPRTSYSYRVRAVNDAGASAWSNEASATTLEGP